MANFDFIYKYQASVSTIQLRHRGLHITAEALRSWGNICHASWTRPTCQYCPISLARSLSNRPWWYTVARGSLSCGYRNQLCGCPQMAAAWSKNGTRRPFKLVGRSKTALSPWVRLPHCDVMARCDGPLGVMDLWQLRSMWNLIRGNRAWLVSFL